MKKLSLMIFVFTSIYLMTGCGKVNPDDNPGNNNISTAQKIAGVFTGPGKKMPNGVFLGTFTGCVTPPGWESNFSTGSSTVNIAIVNDNTVNIILSGGPFATSTYSNISVTQNGNIINFLFGQYDINAKFLTISINTGTYITTNSCLQGLPYFYGTSPLGNGSYGYATIGHLDFSGTKP